MKRSRILALGRPFVITSAIGVPVVGCATSEPLDDSSETAVDAGNQLPARGCPADLPDPGQPCNVAGVCLYGSCYGEPNVRIECIEGRWEMLSFSTCNPPPAPVGPELCPTSEPVVGTPCSTTEPESCEYAPCSGSYGCENGLWAHRDWSSSTCNPPPPPWEPDTDAGTE